MKLRPDERKYKGFILRAWRGSSKKPAWNVSIRAADESYSGVPSMWFCQRPKQSQAYSYGEDIVNSVYLGAFQ